MTISIEVRKTKLDNGEWLFEAFRDDQFIMDISGTDCLKINRRLIFLLSKRFPNEVFNFSVKK